MLGIEGTNKQKNKLPVQLSNIQPPIPLYPVIGTKRYPNARFRK